MTTGLQILFVSVAQIPLLVLGIFLLTGRLSHWFHGMNNRVREGRAKINTYNFSRLMGLFITIMSVLAVGLAIGALLKNFTVIYIVSTLMCACTISVLVLGLTDKRFKIYPGQEEVEKPKKTEETKEKQPEENE